MRRLITTVGVVLFGATLWAQSVKITVPASLAFAVTNVSAATTGSPSPTTVSFSGSTLSNSQALLISVKADADFTPPSGPAIPASRVSWTTSGASNGVGTNGTLSASAYTQLFESTVKKNSGSIDVTWTLAAPGVPLLAGNHVLTLRWKLEAITP